MGTWKKRGMAFAMTMLMLTASAMPGKVLAAQSEEEAKATLFFCSDFQTGTEVSPYESETDVPDSLSDVLENISETVYEDGFTEIDSVLAVGDYTAYTGQYNYDADPTIAIGVFKEIVQEQWENTEDFRFIQGNHDLTDYPYDEGAHEYEEYIVYCINTTYNNSEMGGFPWKQGAVSNGEEMVKLAARNLELYLEECIKSGENRPVFLMVHLPLHFTGRTSSLYEYRVGDNLYSAYLFEVINSAAEDLDIVYLFGHNHSHGWDSYMGGSRVFKQPGDTILIPDLSKKSGSYTDAYTEEVLNFTYLNAGYVGYVKESAAAEELTATVCSVYEDKLVFRRYSEDGLIGIGAEGAYNLAYDDTELIASEHLAKESESPQVIELDRIKESGVKLESGRGMVGEQTAMHAVVKNMNPKSYSWSISDSALAEIKGDGCDAKLFCKKEGIVEVTVSVTDQKGQKYSAAATLEISAKMPKTTITTVRTEELIDGETYMIVGGSQDYSSVRQAITTGITSGSKADSVLLGADVEGLNLMEANDEAEVAKEHLWTVRKGENDTAALYNEAAQKYMHFEVGNRSVTLEEEPTYFEVVWSDYDSSYDVSGRAIGFRIDGWYLNYSDRQGGYCCYNASAYSQDETHFTNQYALYEVKIVKDTLNTAIAWVEAMEEEDYTEESWAMLCETLADVKKTAANEKASQEDVDAALEKLLTAMGNLKEAVLDVVEVFEDVYNDWYKAYVQYVYDYQLMTGIKGTANFAPNANITKAQVAQVLYNMEKDKPDEKDRKVFRELSDVYESEWYADAVAWAYSTGVVTGDLNAKKFFPNADVTREQLALMMYRYAKYKGYDTTHTSDFAGLIGAEKIADWSRDGVTWAVGAGLISGVDKNGVKDIAPQGNASRAQMAAILQRFCGEYGLN